MVPKFWFGGKYGVKLWGFFSEHLGRVGLLVDVSIPFILMYGEFCFSYAKMLMRSAELNLSRVAPLHTRGPRKIHKFILSH